MNGMSAHADLASSRSASSAALIASRDETWLGLLREALKLEYGLTVTALSTAPRGYYAETWKATSGTDNYFVKLDTTDHQQRLRASLPVIDHLWRHGIHFIPHTIRTINDRLCVDFAGGTLALFDWIPGQNAETDDTKPAEYDMLAQVYAVPLGYDPIPRLEFNSDMADRLFATWANLEPGSPADQELQSHREVLERRASRLERLAKICRRDGSGFYATHGDAGGNFMIDDASCYIVDWDEIMLAPPERDAWVMCTQPWARRLFDDALGHHSVAYTLKTERLAYFCYRMLFFYLTEVLSGFNKSDPEIEIHDLLEGWAKSRMEWADAADLDSVAQ